MITKLQLFFESASLTDCKKKTPQPMRSLVGVFLNVLTGNIYPGSAGVTDWRSGAMLRREVV